MVAIKTENAARRDHVIKVRLTTAELRVLDAKRLAMPRSEYLRGQVLGRQTRGAKPQSFVSYQLASLHLLHSIYVQLQLATMDQGMLLDLLAKLARVEAVLLNHHAR